MWLVFLVAWLVLLAVIAVFAQQALGYHVGHLPRPLAGPRGEVRQGAGAPPAGRAGLYRDPRPPEPARALAARPRDRRPEEQPRRPPEGHRARRIDAAVAGRRGAGHLLDAQPIQ